MVDIESDGPTPGDHSVTCWAVPRLAPDQSPRAMKSGFRRPRNWLAVAAFLFFVGWPSIMLLRVRHEVANALGHAKSVRLEEFAWGRTLHAVDVSATEVRSALLPGPDFGVPGLMRMCFIPHHRVVITDDRGVTTTLKVCFACDQLATPTSGILSTSYLWRGRLRELFTRHGLAPKPDSSYPVPNLDD